MNVGRAQALAWRLDRQFLRAGAGSVTDVVGRLGAVPAWSGDANLAIGRRLADSQPDAVTRALAAGEVIETYSFRGSRQLMTAADAGVFLSLRSVSRQWERSNWQQHYRLRPEDWPALRAAVGETLAHGPVSRAEFVERITAHDQFRHLDAGLTSRSDTLFKALAWQGDVCFGPIRQGQPTVQSPSMSQHWRGLPDVDDAGRRAVLGFLSGYGPATPANLHHWLVAGLSAGRRRVDRWLDELTGDAIVEIDVDGQPSLHLRDHLESLAATEPAPDTVTLLPGHDQWVLGPGTDDQRAVPSARRPAVTRGAALVLLSGVVRGTWTLRSELLRISWFDRMPRAALDVEVQRLSTVLQRDLDVTVDVC